jgi:hypothetical protein
VEVQQCMQLTGTNHPSGLIPFGIACSKRPRYGSRGRIEVGQILMNSMRMPGSGSLLLLRPPEHQPRNAGLTSGGQSAVEPPGPIPNPEVKRCSADGIGTTGPVRVGRRQVFARLPQQ